jgi:hypothetical protein
MGGGRNERIRTSDPLVPNEVRYQAALHSVLYIYFIQLAPPKKEPAQATMFAALGSIRTTQSRNPLLHSLETP